MESFFCSGELFIRIKYYIFSYRIFLYIFDLVNFEYFGFDYVYILVW